GERRRLGADDAREGAGPRQPLLVDDTLGLSRRFDRCGLGLSLVGEDAQCRQLVLDLLERGQHGLSVIRDGLIEKRTRLPDYSGPCAGIENGLGQIGSKGPKARLIDKKLRDL